ncbi:MAG: heavy-metal-associated domain-containing protein [Ruminococcaceae bacterium]|nr:heavy-metal-associated domain-containing protein [Oscillospiraceae bacterium]
MLFGKKKNITLSIEGMHCAHCSAKVEKVLKELGCRAVVDLAAGKADVTAPEKLTDAEIAEAVTKAGFPSRVM